MGEPSSCGRLGGGQDACAPARGRKVTGVTPLTRKTKQVYRVAFSFMGVQCREVVSMPHGKAGLAYCERMRGTILNEIERGDFRYTTHFPDSPRAALFGHRPAKTRTLKEALEAYRDRVKKTLERSTFTGYRKAVDNHLVPWCGEKRLDDLAPADIREWMGVQTVQLKTLRNRLLPLRNVLNEAVADDLIKFNPLDRVDLARLVSPAQRESEFEAEPYTEAEIVRLLANLPENERWVFQAWAFTGVRTGEQIGLRWPRVDLEAGVIRIEETTTEGHDKMRPKTKAGRRAIPMLPAAREAFEAQREFTLLANDRVFQNPRGRADGRQWDDKTLAAVWRRAHRDTGIAYRNPYQLRHTWASNLLSQGENIAYIAKVLGHKTIEVSMKTYAKWVEQGQTLGFDRPPRRYGMARLWDAQSLIAATA